MVDKNEEPGDDMDSSGPRGSDDLVGYGDHISEPIAVHIWNHTGANVLDDATVVGFFSIYKSLRGWLKVKSHLPALATEILHNVPLFVTSRGLHYWGNEVPYTVDLLSQEKFARQLRVSIAQTNMETISDDFSFFQRWCSQCGWENQIIRPGKVQCPKCQ